MAHLPPFHYEGFERTAALLVASRIIPLSAPALELLNSMPRFAGCDFVFTTNGVQPPTAWSRHKRELVDKSGVDGWVIHDLRRTVATGMQKLGIALPVTETVLGHTSGSRAGIVGVYQRHDFAQEKRAALDAWGKHVAKLTSY